jgi:hypothetical protein
MIANNSNPLKLFRTATATVALAAVLVAPQLVVQQLGAQQYASGQYPQQENQYQDPPSRVARIGYTQGKVSLEPAGVDTFSQAEINFPLTTGDRIYADNSSLSELQTSGLALRLGNGADVTLSTLTDDVAQFGLAQGSIRLRTRDLSTPDGQQAVVEVDTPNGAILVQRPGNIRVDSYPQDDTTVVTVTSGLVQVTGSNLNTSVGPNQSLRLTGSNPVYTELVRVLPPDDLDQFDAQRERIHDQSASTYGQYVDPDMVGVSDLGRYGDWSPNQDYGQVWFPRAVAADWTPYSNGHWAWVAPWGWTWIEAEPWGFAPFHYGRWANFGGRWGWVPGPPPAEFGGRAPRPVYSPALVAFVGGSGLSISIGGGGGGIAAWFPLGPHEAYTPWYHASPAYVNRVNVTNIYSRDANQVRNTYNNRTANVYNTNFTNTTFVNRQVATTAVAQRDFADGRRVTNSQRIRPDANLQRQLSQAPIIPHPLVTPAPGSAAPQAAPRALPPNQGRPAFETRDRNQPGNNNRPPQNAGAPIAPRAGSPEHNQPATQPMQQQQTPSRAQAPTPQPSQQPYQQQGQRPNQNQQPGQWVRGGFPQQRDHGQGTPVAPTTPQPAPAQEPSRGIIPSQNRPPMQAPPVQTAPVQQPSRTQTPQAIPAPTRPPVQIQPQQNPQQQGNQWTRPVPRPPDQPRVLINQTPPQSPQPPFVQQQQEIQKTDPGRPLGPRQVDNIRNGRPAGPPTQPEAIPHPAPAPQNLGRPGRPADNRDQRDPKVQPNRPQ